MWPQIALLTIPSRKCLPHDIEVYSVTNTHICPLLSVLNAHLHSPFSTDSYSSPLVVTTHRILPLFLRSSFQLLILPLLSCIAAIFFPYNHLSPVTVMNISDNLHLTHGNIAVLYMRIWNIKLLFSQSDLLRNPRQSRANGRRAQVCGSPVLPLTGGKSRNLHTPQLKRCILILNFDILKTNQL